MVMPAAKAKRRQKWTALKAKALATAKGANEAYKKAKKLAEGALDQAHKAQEAYALRNVKGSKPKLSDLTPAQVVRGLGACNGHHTVGLPEDDLEAAWEATIHKQWVLNQVSARMSDAQRRKLRDEGPAAFTWRTVAALIGKTIDWALALDENAESREDFEQDVYDTLDFDLDNE